MVLTAGTFLACTMTLADSTPWGVFTTAVMPSLTRIACSFTTANFHECIRR